MAYINRRLNDFDEGISDISDYDLVADDSEIIEAFIEGLKDGADTSEPFFIIDEYTQEDIEVPETLLEKVGIDIGLIQDYIDKCAEDGDVDYNFIEDLIYNKKDRSALS